MDPVWESDQRTCPMLNYLSIVIILIINDQINQEPNYQY